MAERKKVKKVSLSKQSGEKAPLQKRKTPATKPTAKTANNKVPPTVNLKSTTNTVKTRRTKKSVKTENIIMQPSGEAYEKKQNHSKAQSPYKVSKPSASKAVKPRKNIGIHWNILLGKKREVRRKRISTALIAFPLVLFLVLFITLTPTGPFEAITNALVRIGGGKFPKQIAGSSIISLKSENNVAFAFSNTHLSAYTSSGKELFEYQHDFTAPVLETSAARSLVFNRNATGFAVLNNSGMIYEKNLKKEILCADIADNGSLAFATNSDKYSAQVDVYTKNMKHKFSWYLVDGLISDLALSKNGKYVAIAVLKAKEGSFSSEIYCFNIRSENPLYKISVEGTPVLNLENISSKYFSYITNKSVCFVKWRKGEQKALEEAGLSPSFYKKVNNLSIAVFGKNTSSTVKILAKDGSEKARFVYNGLIDDITLSGEKVYILKGNKVFVLDFDGNVLNTLTNERSLHFLATASGGVFITENQNLMYFGG